MPKQPERGFQYQKRSKDDLKERANMKGGNYDTYIKPKFKQWKPKDGKNLIRILPPTWDDARHYGLDIFVNFSIGADNQAYLALGKHQKGPDPLEEARREAQKEGDKELAKALTPSQRILYWIIDRNDEDEGPLLWAAPFTFDKSLSNLCIDEDTKEVIFIDDPAEGRDVRFYKEGTGLTTKYDPSKMKVLGPSNIAEDEGLENEWLDFIADNPLPEVLNFYDYDHIKATFDGQAGRKDDGDETQGSARRNSQRPIRDREEAIPEESTVRSRQRSALSDSGATTRQPISRSRGAIVESEDKDEPVVTRRGRPRAEPEPEIESQPEAPVSRRRGAAEPPEEGGSLRDRLARRRSQTVSADDD